LGASRGLLCDSYAVLSSLLLLLLLIFIGADLWKKLRGSSTLSAEDGEGAMI